MIVTPARVFETLIAEANQPPAELGRACCCLSAANVFNTLWGIDPMAGLRGYQTERAVIRRLAKMGGLAMAFSWAVGAAGLKPREEHSGAVGCVDVAGGHFGVVPVICVRPGIWFARAIDGLTVHRTPQEIWGL